MTHYPGQTKALIAVDCVIFGFDGEHLQVLLVKRNFEPERNQWSLMGGFLQPSENLDEASHRVLNELTGIENVYMEQLHVFSAVDRDPVERTLSVMYFALIEIDDFHVQTNASYQSGWFKLDEIPKLIFDHSEMVSHAKQHLRYKASFHPILLELLPDKFTIPQLQHLYEAVYEVRLDTRNFSRKVRATGLFKKLEEKDKSSSKKGAYYFTLDKIRYKEHFTAILNLIPNRG